MKKTPKYAQIEAELIAQIESGQLAPGAELPSESDLIECYGVSRVTVRRAIDELYHQGYVEKMQGKRACVKEKVKLQELTSISSYTEEIIRQPAHKRIPCSRWSFCRLRKHSLPVPDSPTSRQPPFSYFQDVHLPLFPAYPFHLDSSPEDFA